MSGLPVSDHSFATLPPHFGPESLSEVTLECWNTVIPGYSRYPETFRQALPYLLASVIYHEPFLRATLQPRHPLFCSQLFAGGLFKLFQGKVLLGVGECEVSGMRACGIPAHFVVAGQIYNLRREMDQLKEAMGKEKEELLQRINSLPTDVVAAILDNISVAGAHPITRADIAQLSDTIIKKVSEMLASGSTSSTPDQPEAPTTSSTPAPKYLTWTWEGRIHPVPPGWKLPRPPVKSFYLLWHFGKVDEGIAPLRTLSRFDVSKQDWTEVCRARSLFHELSNIADEEQLVQPGVKLWELTSIRHAELFDTTFGILLQRLYGSGLGDHRDGDKTVGTVYNKLMKKRKHAEK